MAKPDPLLVAAERLALNTGLLANKLHAAALVCFSTVPPMEPNVFTRFALAAYIEVGAEYEKTRDEFVEKWKAKNEPPEAPPATTPADPSPRDASKEEM